MRARTVVFDAFRPTHHRVMKTSASSVRARSVTSTASSAPSDVSVATVPRSTIARRNRSKSRGSTAAPLWRASASEAHSSKYGMMSPRLRRRRVSSGTVEFGPPLSSAAARLVSLTPTHVPGPAGSTGKIAVRCDRPWTAGGNADARSRRSSRLQPRRNPLPTGTIVTVHTARLLVSPWR